jgi:hypothetical protein
VELTKLIEQCCEEKGLPSFMVKGLIKEVENEKGTWLNTLLEWLASRPTCGKEQRLFLDEIREKAFVNKQGEISVNGVNLHDLDFESDIEKVIKGE